MNDTNRQLATQRDSILASTEVDPRVMMVAKAIQIMQGKNDDGTPKISDEMAIAAAMYQAGTGQLVGRDFYVNDKVGRMEGYRGAARDAANRGAGELQIEYRKLTPDEAEENEVNSGDVAYACEVYQLRAWRLAQQMAYKMRQPCQYKPIIGIGILREVEKFDKKSTQKWDDGQRRYVAQPRNQWREMSLEGGMTWAKKAKNRAYKDALRHVPGAPATVDEILEEGALEGAELPPDGSRLNSERAQAYVDAQLNAQATVGEFRQLTEDEQRAKFAANVATMRAPKEFEGFGDEPEPGGTAGHAPLSAEAPKMQTPAPGTWEVKDMQGWPPGNGHAPDATEPTSAQMFAGLVNADTERAAAAIRARIVGTIRPDEPKAHPDIVTKLQGGLHIAVPNEDERHALTAYMLGSDDSATWTQGAVMAMRTWLAIGKVGDGYAPGAKFLDDWKVIKAAIMPTVEIVGK